MRFTLTAMAVALLCATPAMAKDMGKDPRMNKMAHMEAKTRYFFDRADADGNGVITKMEHDAFANTMFRNADRNRDNVITYKEMKAAKVAEMNEMKEDLRERNAMRDARDSDDRNYDDDRYDRYDDDRHRD